MDSGATVMCSSTLAAEEIQMQSVHQEELGLPTVRDSGRRFRLVDGRINEADKWLSNPLLLDCCQEICEHASEWPCWK